MKYVIAIAGGLIMFLLVVGCIEFTKDNARNHSEPELKQVGNTIYENTLNTYQVAYFKTKHNNFCYSVILKKEYLEKYDGSVNLDFSHFTTIHCTPCDSIKNSKIYTIDD